MKTALNTQTHELETLTGDENTALMRLKGAKYVHPETFEKVVACAGEGTAMKAFFRLERGSEARLDTIQDYAVANRRFSK